MIYKIPNEYKAINTFLERNGIPYETINEKYMVIIVKVEQFAPAQIETYIRDTKIAAYADYLTYRDALYSEQEDIEFFKDVCVIEDYTFMNGNKYFHAVYGEGEELIIKVVKVEA
jgi:hypothetical protein